MKASTPQNPRTPDPRLWDRLVPACLLWGRRWEGRGWVCGLAMAFGDDRLAG